MTRITSSFSLAISGLAALAMSTFIQPSHASQPERITVYSAGPGSLIEQLASRFEQETGISVDVFQSTTGKVLARLEAEAANPRADVVISASWETAQDFEQRGWLLPYRSPNADHVPDQFKSDYYVAQGISALAIIWNPSSNLPEPKDWSDLASPAYAQQVTMPDPTLSGATLDLLLGLYSADAAKAEHLLSALKTNGMNVSGPNAQALTPVLQGAKAAVFGGVDYVSFGGIHRGETLKVIFPESGTVIAPRSMMILKHTDKPDAAKRFIDYALSVEGQEAVAAAWLMPARADVKAQRPLFSELTLLPESNNSESTELRAETLARFSQLFGQ